MHGHDALSLDINPFLVWFGRAKIYNYTSIDVEEALFCSKMIIDIARKQSVEKQCFIPELHNIERWWDHNHLESLSFIRSALAAVCTKGSPVSDLLDIAFCRTLIQLSNVAFNHQSMSFKQKTGEMSLFSTLDDDCRVFSENVTQVLGSIDPQPKGTANVILADSRCITKQLSSPFDIIITSPPYPNRMSYIRELRPYMYWLDYLRKSREAGELDWQAIGGTWGIATSRLSEWEPEPDSFVPEVLRVLLQQISACDGKSGHILSRYVAKYFQDIWQHIASVGQVLSKGAQVHYIVGNSKFYDILVPVEEIYAEMLKETGFHDVQIIPLRKRNSKKELVEFDVKAIW